MGNHIVTALLTVIFACSFLSAIGWAEEKEQIIWECGQNVPNSPYWKDHGAQLEAMLPFDGVMLNLQYPVTEGTMELRSGAIGRRVLGGEPITEEMTQPFVEQMRAAGLKKKHHMVLVWLGSPGPILNYFDDPTWETIRNNIRVVAKAARDVGCAGLVIDPEQYGGDRCWGYSRVASNTVDKPYGAYSEQVRKRGREFGSALSEGFPNAKLLFFYGHSLPLHQLKTQTSEVGAASLESMGDLYAPFLDGMLEGTSDGTIFIDGYEFSYGYATADEFLEARWTILHEALTVTAVPDLFRKKVRCGFGIWTDNRYDGFGWYPYSPEQNRFSPDRLQRAIHLALKYGDGYVWLYNERANWYIDGPDALPHPPATQQLKAAGIDAAYRTAVREAKMWPGLDTRPPRKTEFADARTLQYVYGDELETLLQQSDKVMALPEEEWLFKPDLEYVGHKEKWYLPQTPTQDWKSIKIAEFWEKQGYDNLDGPGWYRRAITFQNIADGKRLYLHFGAVDESCHVWIDGKHVGAYDRGTAGWHRPFAIEVTGFLNNGAHTLIIRAHDNRRMGGIWKPVELIAQ